MNKMTINILLFRENENVGNIPINKARAVSPKANPGLLVNILAMAVKVTGMVKLNRKIPAREMYHKWGKKQKMTAEIIKLIIETRIHPNLSAKKPPENLPANMATAAKTIIITLFRHGKIETKPKSPLAMTEKRIKRIINSKYLVVFTGVLTEINCGFLILMIKKHKMINGTAISHGLINPCLPRRVPAKTPKAPGAT